tara:strand:+ start:71 stop:1063 length:993 start_codon:yes stop_codon:yes gene_type:complete
MKKFVNNIDNILTESLSGFGKAHTDIIKINHAPDFIARANKSSKPKVSLISGGGSGHEPLHGGFVGYGMLDAACPGQVFSAPTPDQMEAAANEVHNEKGILFIVKNYSGDIMNFEMGADMIDHDHATIIVNDDVAVEDSTFTTGRRGVAGTMIVEKTVGSLAETGANLEECKNFGDHVNKMTGSMGVAFTSCTVPAAGKPTFDIAADEMEFGVGIHGEPGRRREKIKSANELSKEIIETILDDIKPNKGEKVLMHVNGFGGTPLMELYLLFECGQILLNEKNINVSRSIVGNYTTSLDMAGGSFTITKLDENIVEHWDSAVYTAALRWKM